jgi:ABC-type transport system involved in multi-copper enzyme maturation permease subunit
MIRLLKIEFFKLRNSKPFWIFSILFLIFMISVPLAVKYFVGHIVEQSTMGHAGKMVMRYLPIFEFTHIWHNITWIYKIMTILLAFITINSVTMEYQNGTIKQNIIDGMSKREYLQSKISMILIFAAFATLVTFLIGLSIGYSWSRVTTTAAILKNIHYLGLYFIYVFCFLLFSLTLSMIIKKSGIAISLIIFYVYIIEPIITAILTYIMKLDWLSKLFPIHGTSYLIDNPFSKHFFKNHSQSQTTMALIVAFGYISFHIGFTYYLISKKDV